MAQAASLTLSSNIDNNVISAIITPFLDNANAPTIAGSVRNPEIEWGKVGEAPQKQSLSLITDAAANADAGNTNGFIDTSSPIPLSIDGPGDYRVAIECLVGGSSAADSSLVKSRAEALINVDERMITPEITGVVWTDLATTATAEGGFQLNVALSNVDSRSDEAIFSFYKKTLTGYEKLGGEGTKDSSAIWYGPQSEFQLTNPDAEESPALTWRGPGPNEPSSAETGADGANAAALAVVPTTVAAANITDTTPRYVIRRAFGDDVTLATALHVFKGTINAAGDMVYANVPGERLFSIDGQMNAIVNGNATEITNANAGTQYTADRAAAANCVVIAENGDAENPGFNVREIGGVALAEYDELAVSAYLSSHQAKDKTDLATRSVILFDGPPAPTVTDRDVTTSDSTIVRATIATAQNPGTMTFEQENIDGSFSVVGTVTRANAVTDGDNQNYDLTLTKEQHPIGATRSYRASYVNEVGEKSAFGFDDDVANQFTLAAGETEWTATWEGIVTRDSDASDNKRYHKIKGHGELGVSHLTSRTFDARAFRLEATATSTGFNVDDEWTADFYEVEEQFSERAIATGAERRHDIVVSASGSLEVIFYIAENKRSARANDAALLNAGELALLKVTVSATADVNNAGALNPAAAANNRQDFYRENETAAAFAVTEANNVQINTINMPVVKPSLLVADIATRLARAGQTEIMYAWQSNNAYPGAAAESSSFFEATSYEIVVTESVSNKEVARVEVPASREYYEATGLTEGQTYNATIAARNSAGTSGSRAFPAATPASTQLPQLLSIVSKSVADGTGANRRVNVVVNMSTPPQEMASIRLVQVDSGGVETARETSLLSGAEKHGVTGFVIAGDFVVADMDNGNFLFYVLASNNLNPDANGAANTLPLYSTVAGALKPIITSPGGVAGDMYQEDAEAGTATIRVDIEGLGEIPTATAIVIPSVTTTSLVTCAGVCHEMTRGAKLASEAGFKYRFSVTIPYLAEGGNANPSYPEGLILASNSAGQTLEDLV